MAASSRTRPTTSGGGESGPGGATSPVPDAPADGAARGIETEEPVHLVRPVDRARARVEFPQSEPRRALRLRETRAIARDGLRRLPQASQGFKRIGRGLRERGNHRGCRQQVAEYSAKHFGRIHGRAVESRNEELYAAAA